MRKLTSLIAASALSLGVLVGVAGAGSAPNTLIHGTVTGKKTQTWHIYSTHTGTAKCKLDKKAWFTCGIGFQTFKHLKNGQHTLRAKAIDTQGRVDSTPAKKTWTVG
jgi:hypothetical protein